MISALKGLSISFASLRQGNLALAAISLSALMFGFEISGVPAILPTLETVLHADFQELQWTMNADTIAVATVLMAAGTLADHFGRPHEEPDPIAHPSIPARTVHHQMPGSNI